MKNITLISDWKLYDPYMAMFKGKILSALPDARLMDITHAVERHNRYQTAILLQGSFNAFPEGTVHLVLTSTEAELPRDPVWMKWHNHYFIGDDNGIFSMLVKQDANKECRRYVAGTDAPSSFLSKMIQLLCWHFEGTLQEHTTPLEELAFVMPPIPELIVDEHRICGHIIHLDSFCNAITDIPTRLFLDTLNGRPFTVKLTDCLTPLVINQYFPHYHKTNEVYLTSNMMGYLEITLHSSHIAILANMEVGNEIVISF